MSKNIFINLPVSDLKKSTSFYQSLGWTVNPQYTDETAACMVVSSDPCHAIDSPKVQRIHSAGYS